MIANHKGEIPFAVLLLPFLLGLIAGLNFLAPAWIMPLTVVLAAFNIIFITLNFLYKPLRLYRLKWIGGVIVNAILFLGGCIFILNYNELNRTDHFSAYKSN